MLLIEIFLSLQSQINEEIYEVQGISPEDPGGGMEVQPRGGQPLLLYEGRATVRAGSLPRGKGNPGAAKAEDCQRDGAEISPSLFRWFVF